MTANHVGTQSEAATADDVRVCNRCGRPVPALHKDEYTPIRARLVATTGFCVCPTGGPDGVAPIPDHGPSLV
jgi:hypothetical protein